jgi:crotonobetainyl-CoA:carnitine CoA-transferase CaiB-like acyl-CoA transferase
MVPHDARPARPLDGYLIADLTRILAGPTATMMLADLGARVIKVERPGDGDDTRQWGPPWAGSSSSYFESANRSKESIALDFADAGDLALATELVDRADIVVQNYRAGALDRFGLDEAAVRARNPSVIYVTISGFGSTAPEPGYDFLVQALGGLMSITGAADGVPTKVGVAMIDLLAAKDTVMGVLAATVHRERTGEGQHVEVNLMSTAVASLANQASSYLATGIVPRRMGNRHPSIAPYETVRCRDGLLALAVGNDRQWGVLARVIGQPALATDPRFATNSARVGNREAMTEALEAALASDDVDGWITRLTAEGVPAGKVNDIAQALDLAAERGLDPLIDVGPGSPAQVRHPVRYSGFELVAPVAPPALDQHGPALRAWLAGPRD